MKSRSLLIDVLIRELEKLSENFQGFTEHVEVYVDITETLQHGVYRIKPEVDYDLGIIQLQMTQVEKKIAQLYVKAEEQLKTEVQKCEAQGEYLFRVPKKFANLLAQFPRRGVGREKRKPIPQTPNPYG